MSRMEPLEWQVLRVLRVILDLQEEMGTLVSLEARVTLVHKVYKESRDQLEVRVRLAQLEARE